VRRYGVSHVSYTWTSLREITYGEPNLNESTARSGCSSAPDAAQPLDSFSERFPMRECSVLRVRRGEAIWRTSPATSPVRWAARCRARPEVRVAAFNLMTGKLELTSSGLGRETLSDEVGLLLTG